MDSPYTNQLYNAVAKMLDERDAVIENLSKELFETQERLIIMALKYIPLTKEKDHLIELLIARDEKIKTLKDNLEELEGEVLFMKEKD